MHKILIISILFFTACSFVKTNDPPRTANKFSISSAKSFIRVWETFENSDFTVQYPQGSRIYNNSPDLILFDLPRVPIAPSIDASWEIRKWHTSDTSLQDLIDQIDPSGPLRFAERIETKELMDLQGARAWLVTVSHFGNSDRRVLVESGNLIFSIDHARDGGYYDAKYDFEKFYKSFTVH